MIGSGEALLAQDTLQAYVVLNRVSPNPRDPDAAEARQAIEGCQHLRLALRVDLRSGRGQARRPGRINGDGVQAL